jgi:hypothetical protein
LADANRAHNRHIFADFAQALFGRARKLYLNESLFVKLDQIICALDGTMVDLCLGVLPWVRSGRRKEEAKLYTMLDLRGSIFCFVWISQEKTHDVTVFDHQWIESGAF